MQKINQSLKLAQKTLLEPTALSQQQINHLLNQLLDYKIDSADLYFQDIAHESWSMENGEIKNGTLSCEQGVGIRAVKGETTGFAYSENLQFNTLNNAVQAARSIARSGRESKTIALKALDIKSTLYSPINPLITTSDQEKTNLLKGINDLARRLDPAIVQVKASLESQYETILIVRHDGQMMPDIRPTVRMQVSVIAERAGRREYGYAIEGCRTDCWFFLREGTAETLTREAVRQALVNLEAVPAPAGKMPVVLSAGWAGVLIHEAVGHGLEGDFNRKGSSAFKGRIGKQVASPECTIVDDGTLVGSCGSLTIDDEGTSTQKTILIEKGILKAYMQDSLNARLMGTQSTGNGRRESYAHLPMPRMTNTYLLPGQYTPEEIIHSVEKGIYAVNFSGGQVDITSGKFVFSACEAYLIEKGKIVHPIKGATLIGHGPDALTKVSMVGKDLKISSTGFCGKNGQTVPVGVGQPTMKIDTLTVGGSSVSG